MKNFFLYILLLSLVSQRATAQTTYYVNQAANGGNNGLNWPNAFTDLQAALSVAQAGDAIWVASGKYIPTSGTNRNTSFALKSGVKMFGGFAGMESSPDQRDLEANPSILSGDIGQPNDSTDNAYTILYLAYPDSSTHINGFIFRHGIAASDTSFNFLSPVLCGGAVYVQAKNGIGLPVFAHCKFLDNYATGNGGAYFVSAANTQGSTPVFRYCEFQNNRAGLKGGAIYLSGGNPYDRGIEFEHCQFVNNRVWSTQGQGGVLYFQQNFGNEEIQFQNCIMDKNTSAHIGGVFAIWFSSVGQVSFLIDSCSIIDNYAKNEGILYLTQSLGPEVPEVNFVMQNSTMANNLNEGLGQIVIDAFAIVNNILYKNNEFKYNTSRFYLIGSALEVVTNNIFTENNTLLVGSDNVSKNIFYKNKGTCVYISGSQTDSSNTGIRNNLFIQNGDPAAPDNFPVIRTTGSSSFFQTPPHNTYITGNLFYQNIYRSDELFDDDSTANILILKNNIFYENINTAKGANGIPFAFKYDSLELAYNLLDLPCAQLPSRALCGPGNILTLDPMFVDAAAGDYRLQPCSPAIDAGSNSAALLTGVLEDFDGNARILDQAVDIGPYESPMITAAQAPTVDPACAGQAVGAVQFDLQNGCQPFSYQWDTGAQTGDSLQQLAAGAYHFTITDQKGKVYETTAQVPGAELLQASSTVLNASGPMNADGSIVVTVQSGTGPFIFLWNTGDTTQQLNNILPGSYTLTITDAAGCSYFYAYTVSFTIGTDQLSARQLSVRPNPANAYLYIDLNGTPPPFQLKLMNAAGQLLRDEPWSGAPISVDRLPNGVYVLQLLHPIFGAFVAEVLVAH